jgi:hypothetical protein
MPSLGYREITNLCHYWDIRKALSVFYSYWDMGSEITMIDGINE